MSDMIINKAMHYVLFRLQEHKTVVLWKLVHHLTGTMYIYKHTAASALMVNDHSAFRVDWMPFSGLRQSGYGIGGIPYTYREMQIEKMLVQQPRNKL